MVRVHSPGFSVGLGAKAGKRVPSSDSPMRLVNIRQLWLDIQIPSERQHQALSSKATGTIMRMPIDTTMDAPMCTKPGPTAVAGVPIPAHRSHTRFDMPSAPISGAPVDSADPGDRRISKLQTCNLAVRKAVGSFPTISITRLQEARNLPIQQLRWTAAVVGQIHISTPSDYVQWPRPFPRTSGD